MNESDNRKTELPGLNLFSTFVMSLTSAAFIEMGIVDDPISKSKRKNVGAAKQHIDLLSMLQEKTKGNLSPDEQHLLTKVLTDLKLEFSRLS